MITVLLPLLNLIWICLIWVWYTADLCRKHDPGAPLALVLCCSFAALLLLGQQLVCKNEDERLTSRGKGA